MHTTILMILMLSLPSCSQKEGNTQKGLSYTSMDSPTHIDSILSLNCNGTTDELGCTDTSYFDSFGEIRKGKSMKDNGQFKVFCLKHSETKKRKVIEISDSYRKTYSLEFCHSDTSFALLKYENVGRLLNTIDGKLFLFMKDPISKEFNMRSINAIFILQDDLKPFFGIKRDRKTGGVVIEKYEYSKSGIKVFRLNHPSS